MNGFSESLLRTLTSAFDELPIGVTVFDRELKLIFANRRFAELLGFPESLCTPGTRLDALFLYNAQRGEYGEGDPAEQARQRFEMARRFEPHQFERVRPNGCVLEVRGQPLEDGGFITTYIDVTERRKAQDALEASRRDLEAKVAERTAELVARERQLSEQTRLLELTFESIDQGISFVNSAMELEVCNQRFLDLLGFPDEFRTRGTPFEKFIRYNAERGEYGMGDIDALVGERVEKAENGVSHAFRRRRPDGTVIEVRGHPLAGGGFVTTYTDVTREAHTESDLRARHDQLLTVMEGMPGGVSLFDSDLRLIAYNQRFVELLDFQELIAINPTPTMEEFARFNAERGEYGDVDVDALVSSMIERARNPVAHVFERTRPNGMVLEVRGAPLPQGGFVTIYTDNTARRQAENELLTRTGYLTEIIASIPQGISVFDANLRLKYWNDEFLRVLELPRDAVYRDVPFADLIRIPSRRGEYGPGDPEEHVRTRVELARQFKAHRFERARPSGTTHLVNGTPLNINGQVAGFITTYTDITDRKQAEAAIRKLLGVQRAILDGAEHSIIATDRDGTIIEFNQGAERMLGYMASEVVGKLTPMAFHHGPEILRRAEELSIELGEQISPDFAIFTAKADRGQRDSHEWTYLRRDGSRLSVLLSITAVRSPEGDVIGYLGIGSDITQWREAEAEVRRLNEFLEVRVAERTEELGRANLELRQAMNRLVQSEKMAALGRLVAGVAHELNTPLGTTLTVASAASHRVEEFGRLLEGGSIRRSALVEFISGLGDATRLIERNSARAARLIRDFKEIASDQASSRRRKFNLRQVVSELLSTLDPRLSRAAVSVTTEIDDTIELDSYPGPLEQIFENLCMNALMHGFEEGRGGTIGVFAREPDEHTVELTISDDGAGMSEEVIRKAFDPFFTTKLGQGGTGLGLYIVYSQVTGVLGGSVVVDSAPGKGTRFVLALPKIAPRRTEPGQGSFSS